MARIDVDDFMFECPVCIEEIDDTWKMLPCQHTFCLSCLEKLYEASQSPQCPTCRSVILVSIEDLQKPRLLFTLFEKYKAIQNEETHNRAVFEEEKESLCAVENDLEGVINLSIQEQDEPDTCTENQTLCCGTINLIEETESKNSCILDVSPIQLGEDSKENVDSNIPISDFGFNKYLKIKHRKPVLDTIMADIDDEMKLNSLKKAEVALYLETVDDYLDALKFHRRDQIKEIIQSCRENRENMENVIVVDNSDENEDEAQRDNRNEDDDLVLALELSRYTCTETDEEILLDITMKKSEKLDPIDSLKMKFLDVKEKLELTMGVIESKELMI